MTIRDMVARHSKFDETKDFIPTPGFATRALYHYVSPELREAAPRMSAWDPAAGEGHMVRVLEEMGHLVVNASDKYNHGIGELVDFTDYKQTEAATRYMKVGLICTNPPYKELNNFITAGLHHADRFLCLLVRIQAMTGQTRYNQVYSVTPPTRVGIFSDRVPFKVGEVTPKCSKMFDHMWMVWDKLKMNEKYTTEMVWIPPTAQQELQKDEDYV